VWVLGWLRYASVRLGMKSEPTDQPHELEIEFCVV